MKISALIVMAALATSAILFCGCETEPATASIHISPSSGTISYGQSIQLTVTGGYDYQWSLSDYSLGYLSVDTGPSAIYTSIYQGDGTNTMPQEITVNSTIQGTQTGASNGTTYAQSATAHITHL